MLTGILQMAAEDNVYLLHSMARQTDIKLQMFITSELVVGYANSQTENL